MGPRFFHRRTKQVVTACCLDKLVHEIFNEVGAQPVFETLQQWLDARFEPAAHASESIKPAG